MIDISNFLQVKCIKKMGKEEQDIFEKLLKHYGPELDNLCIKDGKVFTPHDTNHCLSIYKIISNCILRDDTSYKEDIGLTKRELFLLNLAVLFHDIGMVKGLDAKRDNHSYKSAEYVQKEYNNTSSVLRSEGKITLNECKALKAIIKAHSDVKGDSSIPKDKNGINAEELKKELFDLSGTAIRMRFLAGVLRLADELDVTSDRLGNNPVESELKESEERAIKASQAGDLEQYNIWKEFANSNKHWERLHLFEKVKLNNKKDIICLVVDDEYIRQRVDEGDSDKSLANSISDVFTKAYNEFLSIKEKCFSDSDVKIYVSAESVQVFTENENLREEIGKAQSRLTLTVASESSKTDLNKEKKTKSSRKLVPVVIDEALEKIISEEINKRQLLQFGHFLLNKRFCARDWINVREIVETRDISEKIVNTIIKHINTREIGDAIILGMDMVGALLAARVGFLLQLPVSYFVSPKNKEYHAEQEINIDFCDKKKVIIIVESIATFKTLQEAIDSNNLRNRIDSIYTVLYRKPSIESNEGISIKCPVFSLNNAFPIEIVEKEKCTYKESNCYGKKSE